MKRRIIRVALFLLLGLAFFIFANDRLDRMYAQEQRSAGTGAKVELDNNWYDVEKVANQKEVGRVVDHELFFLLVGLDQNDGKTSEISRSDTMMLVKADFDKGTIDIVSLPRDSYVDINGEMTKLNHAHAYGGIDLTVATIRKWLHIDLDYYVEVNFDAVAQIVDAMGGVEFTVPGNEPLDYQKRNGQNDLIQPGPQKLNGDQALGYLRYREGYANGDIGRVQAQQEFMKVALKQALSPSSIGSIPSFVKTYFDTVHTNIPWNEIVGLLQKVSGMKNATVTTHILEGTPEMIQDVSYYIVDDAKKEELVRSVFPNYVLMDGWIEKEESDAQDSQR